MIQSSRLIQFRPTHSKILPYLFILILNNIYIIYLLFILIYNILPYLLFIFIYNIIHYLLFKQQFVNLFISPTCFAYFLNNVIIQ